MSAAWEGPSELVLLANTAMRARRRPRVILALWAWQAAIAILLVSPLGATVRVLYGNGPRGDAPLWGEGGLALMDAGLRARVALPAILAHSGIVLAFALVLGLVPTSAAFASITFTTRDLGAPNLRQTLARAFAAFGPTALIFMTTLLAQLLFVLVGVLAGSSSEDALYVALGEARAEQIGWVVTGLFALLACVVGVAGDVARAAVVRFRVGPGRAMTLALATLRRAPVTLTWSWAWRGLASFVPIAFGSLVAERLGGRGGLALLSLALVHQVVALSRVALRVSWLAKATRAVDGAYRVVRVVSEVPMEPEPLPSSG